jgi:hypothetical protein
MSTITRLRPALILPLLAAVAACSDAVGPTRDAAPTAPTAPAFDMHGLSGLGGNGSNKKGEPDTAVTVFTVVPHKDYSISIDGKHRLDLPADAICDPEYSSYGPGTWDEPCEAFDHPIKITAYSWRDDTGYPRVAFVPSLRFAPGKIVLLVMKDRAIKLGGMYTILYCGEDGLSCVDESLSDPTLHTFVNQKAGFAFRRIKHFSVYNLVAE